MKRNVRRAFLSSKMCIRDRANTQEILPLTRKVLFDDGENLFTGVNAVTKLFRTFASSRAGELMRIEGDDPAKAARILMSQLKLKVLSGQI